MQKKLVSHIYIKKTVHVYKRESYKREKLRGWMKTVVNAFLFNMSLGECYAYPLVHIAMKLGPIQDVTCV